MSADMFMLELFIKDARAQCAVLSSNIFSGSSFSADACKNAAASLKSSAKMLGFDVFSSACAALESVFAKGGGKPSADSPIGKLVKILSECAESSPSEVESKVSGASVEISELLRERLVLPDSGLNGSPQNAERPESSLAVDESMASMFLDETRAQLASIGQLLIEIEDDFKNPQKLERLMRACHSIKGAARVVGLSDIVDLTHKMEDCFVAAQNSKIELDSDSLDAVLDCVDFIYSLAEIRFSKIDKLKLGECMAALHAIGKGAAIPEKTAREAAPGR